MKWFLLSYFFSRYYCFNHFSLHSAALEDSKRDHFYDSFISYNDNFISIGSTFWGKEITATATNFNRDVEGTTDNKEDQHRG